MFVLAHACLPRSSHIVEFEVKVDRGLEGCFLVVDLLMVGLCRHGINPSSCISEIALE